MLQLNPQEVNRLKQLMAAGKITPDMLQGMDIRVSDNGPQQNALAPMLSPQEKFAQGDTSGQLPMGSMRNEATGAMTYFQPNPQAPRTQEDPGFSDRPYPMTPQAAQQRPKMRVVGYGNGQATDLGEEDARAMPVDYTRPAVDIPGVGKGRYTADGRSAIVSNPDGSQTKVILGYDAAGSDALTARALARDKARADIASTEQGIAASQEHVAASQQQRTKGKTTPVPSGYERAADGSGLRPIKGGPADFKQQGMYNADTATMQSSFADLDRLGASANELLKHKGLEGITGMMGALPNIPGGKAADAEAKLATLKSQVGFGVLQAMRNASKTGGALGNVSDAEGKRLEANLAALDKAQSIEQFRESLGKIVEFSTGAKDRLANAYQMKYNGREGMQVPATDAPAAPTAAPQAAPKMGEIRKGHVYTGGDPASPASWRKVRE